MNPRRTSLHARHVALGAKIVDFAGWDMPVQYTSVKEEVLAVRRQAGLFDVSHMGEFFAEGPDAIDYVDALVTNDVANAPIGKAVYSPLCREDGTVVDDLIVYKLAADRALICVNAGNIEKDYKWMQGHVAGFNVRLTNRSEEFSLLALQGPDSLRYLKAIVREFPEAPYYSVWEGQWHGKPVILARTGYTGEDGFEIFADHATIGVWWEALLAAGVKPCGLAARDVLRLEVCYPLYGHELTDDTTPFDAGLGWTVKKAKPRFMGKGALQDAKPRFKLVKLLLEKGIPREGYRVLDGSGQELGRVTSGTMSVVLNQGIALARIDAAAFLPDQQYFIEVRQTRFPAKAVTKPFVQGGHA